ncbi:hypothetical protein LWE61_16230 [Sphingobium sufflavum]|uniref:hypothetical protein n=1 Tax=Sphingobium sufflavum TaxID=1129547 RepID=UPI001F1609D3|nr:hypothetical protein [Sphingobium sufflavum]MCE7798096.1 hypothetical protein [Sphingobium sufflavum]
MDKFKEAFDVLGGRVVSAGTDFIDVAVKQWLGLSPQERDTTALYSSGRASRAALNEGAQQGLQAEGTLSGAGRELTTLSQVNVTREEMRFSGTYKAGQVMDVVRNNGPDGLPRGRYEVVGQDKRGNVQLIDENGRKTKFDPQKIDPADKRDPIALSAKEQIKIYEGDKILWTQADKSRQLEKSDRAVVIGVTAQAVSVLTAKGETITLNSGDKMLERLGLAYAINMNQAQGMTSDNGIGVMHSSERNLSNQRLTHVMATRVRDDITIVTNDREQLLRTINDNPGNKASALETIGEKSRAQQSADLTKASGPAQSPTATFGPRPGHTAADFRIDPSTHVDPKSGPEKTAPVDRAPAKAPTLQIPYPEKTIDLSL